MSTGRVNASVLPDPVGESSMMSFASDASLIILVCIGFMFSMPSRRETSGRNSFSLIGFLTCKRRDMYTPLL